MGEEAVSHFFQSKQKLGPSPEHPTFPCSVNGWLPPGQQYSCSLVHLQVLQKITLDVCFVILVHASATVPLAECEGRTSETSTSSHHTLQKGKRDEGDRGTAQGHPAQWVGIHLGILTHSRGLHPNH